jgi:hypothetical protein
VLLDLARVVLVLVLVLVLLIGLLPSEAPREAAKACNGTQKQGGPAKPVVLERCIDGMAAV